MTRHHAEMRRLAARYAMHAATERRICWMVCVAFGCIVGFCAMLGALCLMSPQPFAALFDVPGMIFYGLAIRKRWRAAQQRSDEFLQLRQEALDEQ